MSTWQEIPKLKPLSFFSHLQAGFIVSACGPAVTPWHPAVWAAISIAVGYLWELGYWQVVSSMQPDAMIVIERRGWPRLGRTWDIEVSEIEQPGGADILVHGSMVEVENKAHPSGLDLVPFILGSGLGLLFYYL